MAPITSLLVSPVPLLLNIVQTIAASEHIAAATSLEAQRQSDEQAIDQITREAEELERALAQVKAERAANARGRTTEAQRAREAAQFYNSLTDVLAATVAT